MRVYKQIVSESWHMARRGDSCPTYTSTPALSGDTTHMHIVLVYSDLLGAQKGEQLDGVISPRAAAQFYAYVRRVVLMISLH